MHERILRPAFEKGQRSFGLVKDIYVKEKGSVKGIKDK